MIRVLVVDDSAVVRQVLSTELSKTPDIQVVATATDPYVARDKIVKLKPDVVTLDLEMPRMDGLTFLIKLMKYNPLPVVIVSSLTPEGGDVAIRALELGALDVICKPNTAYSVADVSRRIINSIRAAARARVVSRRIPLPDSPPSETLSIQLVRTTHQVIAIGASTGGTQAIREILQAFPAATPGVLIVQHMPQNFTAAFARRLNDQCALEVREAKAGDHLVPGLALLAPGDHHMVLRRSGTRYVVEINQDPRIRYQRPSVDVLFHSVARSAGPNSVGVLLTGMGVDGARGLLAMREKGARTFAQDEASCAVFGMPREAMEIGAAEQAVSIEQMAGRIVESLARIDAVSER